MCLHCLHFLEYHEAFRMFDVDGVGTFSAKKLGEAVKSLGQNLTNAELAEFTKELDIDGECGSFTMHSIRPV